jgi:hypothetical protein
MISRRDALKMLFAVPFGSFDQGIVVRLALLHDGSALDALLGARMAVREAQRAATLLKTRVLAVEREIPAKTTSQEVEDWVALDHPTAVVVLASSGVERVLPALQRADVVINACAPHSAGLRAPNLYHVWPVNSGTCVLWQPTLERYGAAQLNARYRAAYDANMNGPAWAGWFAVKLVWESAARSRSGESRALAKYLQSTRAAFDGHKGELLRFTRDTHELQQPLYCK